MRNRSALDRHARSEAVRIMSSRLSGRREALRVANPGEPARDEHAVDELLVPVSATNSLGSALSVWADHCFVLGLDDLAVDLLDSCEPEMGTRTDPQTRIRRGVYLLHAGRFAEALECLPRAGSSLPMNPYNVSVADVVQTAAKAALGDDAACDRLVSMSSH